MSSASILVGLPDPFSISPSFIAVPLTQTQHVSGLQVLSNSSTGVLTASQLVAPLVLNLASATGAFVLPPAFQLANAFGSSAQVQVGDLFVIPVIPLSTDANVAGFYANPTGGSGTKTVPAYGTNANPSSLTIQFTSTTPGAYSYTLQ